MYMNTRFADVLKGLPRGLFDRAVEALEGDKYSKGFGCWDQFTAMVYAQLSGSRSLREVEAGFNSQRAHHYHLRTREVKRSTLAKANEKRPSAVYEQVCRELMEQVRGKPAKALGEWLYLVDATPIGLKGRGYDEWTQANHSHRTQGLKVHVQIEADSARPVYLDITAPNVNDVDKGRELRLERGSRYVFDKGYCDYNWWYQIHCAGARFVTRLKKNAGIVPVESHPIEESAKEIIVEDSTIRFKHKSPGGQRINDYYDTALRRIVVHRADKKTPLVLVSNDFERSAEEVAALYKRRWEIELFFKWLKQNLKIKRFLGQSENAVKIQIYIAMITYLLLWLYRRGHGVKLSMTMCRVMVCATLFQRPQVEQIVARRRRRRRREFERSQGSLALA